jgi:hypothetical protein
LCKGTPYFAQKLAAYKTCSGYDIGFVGPLCTSDKMALVGKAVNPIPYQLFATCALNSSSNSQLCSSGVVTQFLNELKTTVGDGA